MTPESPPSFTPTPAPEAQDAVTFEALQASLERWITRHRRQALLGAFGLGVFLGVLLRR